MDDKLGTAIVSILTSIIGVAILALILSNKANTSGVISSFSDGFSKILSTALSPVAGN